VSGQLERDIGAPIFTSANSSVRLAYFHSNRLLTDLYKKETEIRWRKDDNKIKKQTDNLTFISHLRQNGKISLFFIL
jgi:hypothetical protein